MQADSCFECHTALPLMPHTQVETACITHGQCSNPHMIGAKTPAQPCHSAAALRVLLLPDLHMQHAGSLTVP